jgi:hypothetical protein
MNITTKYDVGKSAFTMIDNKVSEVQIREIRIEITDGYGFDPTIKVKYYASKSRNHLRRNFIMYNESELYATKEELLENI